MLSPSNAMPPVSRAVADHGDDLALLAGGVERGGGGQTVGVPEHRGRVAVLDPVVRGLGPAGVAGDPSGLPQGVETVPSSGQQLVDVGLVPGVPEDDVVGGVEDPVECDGELDRTEVRAEMALDPGGGLDDHRAELVGQLGQFVLGETSEVRWFIDVVQDQPSHLLVPIVRRAASTPQRPCGLTVPGRRYSQPRTARLMQDRRRIRAAAPWMAPLRGVPYSTRNRRARRRARRRPMR